MSAVDRTALPDAFAFFEGEGLKMIGNGKWRTTRCQFHGGSDSMRVNTESGGWCCMSCGAKGGDAISYLMQRDGIEFVDACKRLGAWVGVTAPAHPQKPAALAPRAAMGLVARELGIIVVVISDARRGRTPSDADWQRFLAAAGRIQTLCEAYA